MSTLSTPTSGAPAAPAAAADVIGASFTPVIPVADGVSERWQAAIARANAYAERSLSTDTVRSYRDGWERFVTWCDQEGLQALPAEPIVVAGYLTWLADGDAGASQEPLATATILHRLAAINRAHKVAGHPRPGDDGFVRSVVAGIRRELGVAAEHAKAALEMGDLLAVLATTTVSARAVRDRALLLAATAPNATAAGLARLCWSEVTILPGAVELVVTHRSWTERIVLRANPSRPGRCPARAFEDLLGGRTLDQAAAQRVFAAPDRGDAPLTPEGLTAIVRSHLGPWDGRGLPEAVHLQLGGVLDELALPATIDLRDRVLIACGWYGALRRSNVAMLCWGDLLEVTTGVQASLRRSKTDPTGRGTWVLLPRTRGSIACPVTALEAWRERVTELLGRPPRADEPVLCQVTRGGKLRIDDTGAPLPLSGDAIAAAVKRRAKAAGLDAATFSGHSLRAGFITTAARAGVPADKIAEQSNTANLNNLLRYIRKVRAEVDNAALDVAVALHPKAPQQVPPDPGRRVA